MFGKYRVVSNLGQGNSSKVFLVEHTKLKAYRAVKCVAKTLVMHPQFLLEVDILKNLKHPGIPTIYDVEEDEKAYYIIEEYIQGQSLEAFVLHQDCISTETVIQITMQICEVLQYLHGQKPKPIIYQDMKPEHIILCGERIVLIDFGISSYITSSGNTFQNFGTEGYAAPEKYQGIPCDARTDIYGVGKVLEFMAANLPVKESRILKPLIWKATAYASEDRYPSIEAMASELDGIYQNGYQNIHKKRKKHLLTEIAVAGTQERVGVTHVAIALSCFLNRRKRPCIYQECHVSDSLKLIAREGRGCVQNDGMVTYGKFRGMPCYDTRIGQDSVRGSYVQDYGIQIQDLLEDNKKLILVMGGRPWECERTRNLLEQLCARKNLAFVLNYNNHAKARSLSRKYHHRIYCFPLDADPFLMTREKRRFFKRLLRKERW